MKIYLRKIDEQCINKQISYPKDILKDFLDGKGEKDTIVCEGKQSHYTETVGLLLSTDPRFDNGIKRVLAAEGNYSAGDIMVMYKLKSKYIVELVKPIDQRYNSFSALFAENDRHLLANVDDVTDNDGNYNKFKKLLAWFVNQLNVNNGISFGNKTSGQGYKDGASIREKYKEWRDYGDFTLDCNIISGYQSTFSKVNYINKTGTGINLRPRFDKGTKEVVSLSIDLYKNAEGLSDEVISILNEEYQVSDLMLFDNAEPNENLKNLFDNYCKIINMFSSEDNKNIAPYNYSISTLNDGQNLIIYGTPGCGKSYYVEHTLLKDYPKENYIRTTFFQDYTNTDFVGQILPKVEGEKVTYEFNPGPFTLALEQAIRKPNERIALVIEELNRGSAASIFGDIFQLLDRKNGVSEYSIMNVNVMHYLEEKFNGQYTFSDIKLPSNLSIFATMNTSDQNVFILDTAFKRRWKFKKLLNVFDSTHTFKSCYIPGANITWQEFVEGINDYILRVSNGLNSEDKQLGVYFVDQKGMRKDVNEVPDEAVVDDFAYKVLEYLWADVAKFDRSKWFNEDVKCLDDLVKEYKKTGLGVFNNDVFNK